MDIKEHISQLIAEKYGLIQKDEVYKYLEKPNDPKNGDLSLPCFRFAKSLSKSPRQIADEILECIEYDEYFSGVNNVNGFLNITLNNQKRVDDIMNDILDNLNDYGKQNIGEYKTICIDYSSINIAKPFHIGHLSSTAIGSALYKIYLKLGYNVVGINHLGDWGTQFGALIEAYKRWGSDEEIEKNGIKALFKYYVKFHKYEKEQQKRKAKKLNITSEDEIPNIETLVRKKARIWFKKIEDKDEEATNIFNKFKEITLNEVKGIYQRLHVNFDSYNGESFYNDKMEPIVQELITKKMLVESSGAKIVEFKNEEGNEIMPPCIIKRSDGASLYMTRDLAAAFYRKIKYSFYKSLYVVAYQQNLHFKQLFEIIKKMGYTWANDMEHVEFGMVSLASGAMKTREGRVVFLEDVLNTAVEKAKNIIAKKNPNLKNKEDVAESVGVGAVLFSALNHSRIKDIVFSYDNILNFDGETAPYIQYTYARCKSLMNKCMELANEYTTYPHLNNEEAREVIYLLGEYPSILRDCAAKNEPSILARYLIDVSQAFNKFYAARKIISSREDVAKQEQRILLVFATATVIRDGLSILGINAPAEM